MTAVDWAKAATRADATLSGLAELERVALADEPAAEAKIHAVVAEFTPRADQIEAAHDGRAMMTRVNARLALDARPAKSLALALFPLLLLLMPTVAFGIIVRWTGDVAGPLTVAGILVGLAALLAIVLWIAWRADRTTLGVAVVWSTVSSIMAVFATIAGIVRLSFAQQFSAWLVVIGVGAVAIIAFTVANARKQTTAKRARARDLAPIQPAVDAYLSEFGTAYRAALEQISASTAGIDPAVAAKIKTDRDKAFNEFTARGFIGDGLPSAVYPMRLGELQLFAVASPLLGNPKSTTIR
jgi:hypothetical protein